MGTSSWKKRNNAEKARHGAVDSGGEQAAGRVRRHRAADAGPTADHGRRVAVGGEIKVILSNLTHVLTQLICISTINTVF